MSTRSHTFIIDGKTAIACLYRQYDGYIDGHGQDVAKFLAGKGITNGLDGEKFNGIGDLGIRLFTALKGDANEGGSFYLQAPDVHNLEEYNYFVSIDGDYYFADARKCSIRVKVLDYNGRTIFDGSPEELLAFSDDQVAEVDA